MINEFHCFQSRNGTYVNHKTDGETHHYTNNAEEIELDHEDVISFGFNICSVYDPNEKNIFMYRLLKKPIVTISLDSDDDEDDGTQNQQNNEPVEQNNETIELDSESDVHDSGDECFQDIDDVENGNSTSSFSQSDYTDDESIIDDGSIDSSESESFVVSIQYKNIFRKFL